MTAKWNWAEQRRRQAFLALDDGTVMRGHSVGAGKDALGEVVFNTGMSGYQEILSDPSYNGQFVTMTCPEIGNVGINAADMESRGFFASGFVVHHMQEPSNWRSEESLSEALKRRGIPALAGVDTRALTARLRETGTRKGYLSVTGRVSEEQAVREAREWCGLDGQDYASKVSCERPYEWDPADSLTRSWGIADVLPPADLRVVAFDFGIKWNILRSLRRSGMRVTVVPARTSAEAVLAMRPDGVFLSNGPADPAAVRYAIEAARTLIGKVPVMGICLGHQILGWAFGGRTYRLKFGHHGCNHPVKDLETGDVEITSQNHNFSVAEDSLDGGSVEVTHLNLNDGTVEGIRHRSEPVFSVQYHPEAGPGPHDPFYLFGRFRDLILQA
jgi:carbamoyl-phosphate synthase small subunit